MSSSREGRERSSSGVSVRLASAIGANAEITSETGATTERWPRSSVHSVRMESESLPTGMVMPSLAQRSTPTASTVAYRSASSPG